jgi:GAF domain-containing protein
MHPVADQRLTRTFVELADTLVDDYDLIDFAHRLTTRCVELLGIAEAGVILRRPGGELQVLASSSELARFVELIEVQVDDGPCVEAWEDGKVVRSDRLAADLERWPRFVPLAMEAGFRSAYGIPMRLRDERIGALNLFAEEEHGLNDDDEDLALALADIATIGITHAWSVQDHATLAEQLQSALDSRVTIEQAKGVLMARAGVAPEAAFEVLRQHARSRNRRLTEVAADVVQGRLGPSDLGVGGRSPQPRAVANDHETA